MNDQEKQEVKAIFAESLWRMTGPGHDMPQDVAEPLRAEAARLDAEVARVSAQTEGGDKFKGVKYVVKSTGGNPSRIMSREEWFARQGWLPAESGALLLEGPDGGLGWWPDGSKFTPWHPKVGDEVRYGQHPEQVGDVTDVTVARKGCYPLFRVKWRCLDERYYRVEQLRPFSFAPPEPEPAPEFEKGELVVDAQGDLRVVEFSPEGTHYLSLTGDCGNRRHPPYRRAAWMDVVDYAREYPACVLAALRAHAQRIAEEAGK